MEVSVWGKVNVSLAWYEKVNVGLIWYEKVNASLVWCAQSAALCRPSTGNLRESIILVPRARRLLVEPQVRIHLMLFGEKVSGPKL